MEDMFTSAGSPFTDRLLFSHASVSPGSAVDMASSDPDSSIVTTAGGGRGSE
eukprot:CAMPEP_0185762838 /NCGR_PEP_ID=MMETSP1174-20130828/21810_1 /TAXON_ID=35687 /ORGANISM="Dictyocha speculum, Strain CCMP1381" /LENGTH=51 /DNA_ID=CAMNT_0028444689 /DNA_START=157 /DNA_END=315 /DNA_ORIENTATION=-